MNRIFFFLFFCNITATDQHTISGKIQDIKNKPAVGISISLRNTYDGTTSDSLGNYSFTTDEKGIHVLQATSTGYKPFEQKINLDSPFIKINIFLKEKCANQYKKSHTAEHGV